MKREKINAEHVMDQPGDGTRYDFIVTDVPEMNQVIIAGTGKGAKFKGYTYRKASIISFLLEFPDVLINDRDTYRDKVGEIMPDRHFPPFVGYICDDKHSDCNPWTALAAMRAAYAFIKEPL